MPFVIIDRERISLPLGESIVGGSGPDSILLGPLTRLSPVAVIWVGPDRMACIRRIGSTTVTANGAAVGEEPVILTHGSHVEFANLRVSFDHAPADARAATHAGPGVTAPH
jgi:hypothetical protein